SHEVGPKRASRFGARNVGLRGRRAPRARHDRSHRGHRRDGGSPGEARCDCAQATTFARRLPCAAPARRTVSTALAIAGVTQVLLDLFNDGIVNHNVSGVLGTSVTVSLLPPDRVIANNGGESTQLNLFLHHVSPNAAYRNDGLPARDGAGRTRLSRAPLALDL